MEVQENEILFLDDVIWELTDHIEIYKFIYNEKHHVKGVVFRNTENGEMVNCTFKQHGIIRYKD